MAYRNYLPKKCPGLENSGKFAYKVNSSRLCRIDTITVLERSGGGGVPLTPDLQIPGFQPGFTCRLGEFHPLSPAEIASMKVEKRRGRRSDGGVREEPVAPEKSEQDSQQEPAPADPAAKP